MGKTDFLFGMVSLVLVTASTVGLLIHGEWVGAAIMAVCGLLVMVGMYGQYVGRD